MITTNRIGFVAALAMGTSFGVACRARNDNHCFYNAGNDTCDERYGGERPFCVTNCYESPDRDGCVAERPEPLDGACYSPCGDEKTADEDPSCEGVAETSTGPTTSVSVTTEATETTDDATMTTTMTTSMSASESETEVTSETEPTTGPTGCVSSLECTDPGSPVCVDEVCSPCGDAADGDAACEAKDPLAPACGEDGECVECTSSNALACEGLTPVCDAGSSACVGCTYHEQCAVGACEMATGACFTDMCVTEVDDANGETIGEALGDGCVIVLRAGSYDENVVVDAGMVVAIVTMPNEVPVIIGDGANANPTIEVSGGGVLYMQGVEVSGNGGVGVLASGGSVWLDRSRVVANLGGGMVLMTGADGHVRNCFVGGAVNQPALDLQASTLDATYSTLGGSFGNSPALICDDTATATVRNGVLVSQADGAELQCEDAEVTYSASEMAIPGMGNEAVSDVESAEWFVGYDTGDFHLSAAGAAVFGGIAEWTAVDPLVDIDGDDARPNEVGAADVAGADVP